jgi:hypothetical protein
MSKLEDLNCFLNFLNLFDYFHKFPLLTGLTLTNTANDSFEYHNFIFEAEFFSGLGWARLSQITRLGKNKTNESVFCDLQ